MQLEEKRIKSPLPYFTIGVVWLFYGIVFPMYRLSNILIAAAISIVVFEIARRKSPDRVIMVEKPVQATGNELADEYIKKGRDIVKNMYSVKLSSTTIEKDKNKLIELTTKILDFIAKYPAKARTIMNFMDYYLPTSLTLLQNYENLLAQGQASENISASKDNIEKIMPTMVVAFEKQLDALFEDKALDISAEVSLLKDLLQREGLQ